MGNTWFCNRCDQEKFNLSRACADQFLNVENKDKEISSEERWMLKLKCMDDVHSKKYGITPENFNLLLAKLDTALKEQHLSDFCKSRDYLMDCLKRNPLCMLNCKREMDEFIDCVDTLRIRRIKERIEEGKKGEKKPDFLSFF